MVSFLFDSRYYELKAEWIQAKWAIFKSIVPSSLEAPRCLPKSTLLCSPLALTTLYLDLEKESTRKSEPNDEAERSVHWFKTRLISEITLSLWSMVNSSCSFSTLFFFYRCLLVLMLLIPLVFYREVSCLHASHSYWWVVADITTNSNSRGW